MSQVTLDLETDVFGIPIERPTAKPGRRRVERTAEGKPARPSGWASPERPKAWVHNTTALTLWDIEQGLNRRLRPYVAAVHSVSADPDEPIVTGTYRGAPFAIRAQAGDDLPAVLNRLLVQLGGKA